MNIYDSYICGYKLLLLKTCQLVKTLKKLHSTKVVFNIKKHAKI